MRITFYTLFSAGFFSSMTFGMEKPPGWDARQKEPLSKSESKNETQEPFLDTIPPEMQESMLEK